MVWTRRASIKAMMRNATRMTSVCVRERREGEGVSLLSFHSFIVHFRLLFCCLFLASVDMRVCAWMSAPCRMPYAMQDSTLLMVFSLRSVCPSCP